MSDYKRKKVKPFSRHKRDRSEHDERTHLKRKKSDSGIVPEEDIKVVRGTKYKRAQTIKFVTVALAVLTLTAILLSVILPVSIYENIVNFTAVMGPGNYPVDVSGGTVLNAVSNGTYYYVLTDTNISAYSNGGKVIFDELHGFSNPIITVSDTRAVVYDQGGKCAYVYNLGGKIHTLETDNAIIVASISRNGDFAVATHSDSYTSVVTVYDKNLKQLYVWNSAKEIINNVLINPAGNRIAISTIGAVSGQYSSKVSIFDFSSADPLHTVSLDSSLVLKLSNTGKGISIVCANKYVFLHWSKFTVKEISAEGEINMFRQSKNGVLLTFNRINNRNDNTIVLISNKGEKTSEFKLQTSISDIQYNKGRIYLVNDKTINIYDRNGKQLRFGNCKHGVIKIAVLGANSVASITDLEITKTNIEKGAQ